MTRPPTPNVTDTLCPYCRRPLGHHADDIEPQRCYDCGPISDLELERYRNNQCPTCGTDRSL